MIPEAPLEQTEHGLVPAGPGWFVLNARDALWRARSRRQGISFTGPDEWEADNFSPMLGVNLFRPRAGRAELDVPLGDRGGGVLHHLRRGAPDRRGPGAAAQAVGLRLLPAEDEPRDRRRGRRAMRRAGHELTREPAVRAVRRVHRRTRSRAKYGASPSGDDAGRLGRSSRPWEISHPAAYQDGWLPGS